MSLCDSCYNPGQCCKNLNLFHKDGPDGSFVDRTFWTDKGDEGLIEQVRGMGLPFVPAIIGDEWTVPEGEEDAGRRYAIIWWNCPKLTPEGRCGDYENRPAICRSFEPASTPLCCHYRGGEGVDLRFTQRNHEDVY